MRYLKMEKDLTQKNLEINQENLVKEFFINFINAMNAWEREFNLSKSNSHNTLKFKLEEIFKQYCTNKRRKYGRPEVLYSEDPPEYDINEYIIESIELNDEKFIIYTKQKNKFQDRFRFFILQKNGQFKIDKKERFSKLNEKWVKYNL
ncbi:NTF2 fold immunity protein [Pasteurella sp. PK-2025]|uniref:NTF2 fold immunity protein n=1 Tax=unclassified Pasteurella TaxID=2621516 RepID=UPI003C708CE5